MSKIISTIKVGSTDKEVLEVGKTYKFYDDGKISPMRQFNAKVLRIITKEDGKEIMFPTYCCEDSDWEETTIVYKDEKPHGQKSLYDVWETKKQYLDWVFAEDTKYFIECSIPRYDKDTIWFAERKDGGWYSMDIQSYWQGGLLDIFNNLTEELEVFCKENNIKMKTDL